MDVVVGGAIFQAGNGEGLMRQQGEGTAAALIESHCIYSFITKLTGIYRQTASDALAFLQTASLYCQKTMSVFNVTFTA